MAEENKKVAEESKKVAEESVPLITSGEDIPPVCPALTESDMDEIPHPTMELYRHTILRGANLGSVVSLIIGPPYLYYKGVRSPGEFIRRLGSFTAKGMVSSCS